MTDDEQAALRGAAELAAYIQDIDSGRCYWRSDTWPTVRADWLALLAEVQRLRAAAGPPTCLLPAHFWTKSPWRPEVFCLYCGMWKDGPPAYAPLPVPNESARTLHPIDNPEKTCN